MIGKKKKGNRKAGFEGKITRISGGGEEGEGRVKFCNSLSLLVFQFSLVPLV